MNRTELLKALKKLAKKQGVAFNWEPQPGKGGHGRVTLGDRRTIIASGEIPTGTLAAILRQLAIKKKDLDG